MYRYFEDGTAEEDGYCVEPLFHKGFVIKTLHPTVFPKTSIMNRLRILYQELIITEMLVHKEIRDNDDMGHLQVSVLRYGLTVVSMARRLMWPFYGGESKLDVIMSNINTIKAEGRICVEVDDGCADLFSRG